MSLSFKVGETVGEVAATIDVLESGNSIARVTRSYFPARSRQVYRLAWRAPKARANGVLRFCVVLSGRVGNSSKPSCAPIDLK